MNWALIGMQILKTLGAIIGTMVTQLLAGKAIKRLILLPFQWLTKKTETPKDDAILKEAEKDLGLEEGEGK